MFFSGKEADSMSVPASTISGCSIATYVNFQAAESLRIFYLLRNGQSENDRRRPRGRSRGARSRVQGWKEARVLAEAGGALRGA